MCLLPLAHGIMVKIKQGGLVHKGAGKSMFWPRAEDADYGYTMGMGMNLDLDIAIRNATQETVRFLQTTRGLSAADAYSLASIGVDFHIAEAVDAVQLVHGAIPKRTFKTNPDYWHKK